MKKIDIALIVASMLAPLGLAGTAAAQDMTLERFPLDLSSCGGAYVSAHFDHSGKDYHCGKNRYSGHKGTDFAPKGGGPCTVVAAAPGEVVATADGNYDANKSSDPSKNKCCGSGSGCSYGNYVKVKQEDGTHVVYAHMKKNSLKVKKGDKVTCGQALGIQASSGCSTGTHLHFDISTNSSSSKRFDPYQGSCGTVSASRWVSQGNYCPSSKDPQLPGSVCQCKPACDGKACGDDGCGGQCGTCAANEQCNNGACQCVPQCEGKVCGEDGCGAQCGTCVDGLACNSGACACMPTAIENGGTFGDIEAGSENETIAVALQSNNIAEGCQSEPPMFCPDCPITHLQAARMVGNALTLSPGETCTDPYPDITEATVGIENCSIIAQLKEMGVILSTDENFSPNDYTTRAAAAALLTNAFYNAAEFTSVPATFTDVAPTDWYFPHVEALARKCITMGCSDTEFCPNKTIPRMAFATLLARIKGYVTATNCLQTIDCETNDNCTPEKFCLSNQCVECDTTEAICLENTAKKCVDHFYQYTECTGKDTCVDGECVETLECLDTEEPTCEGDNVKTCVDGKYSETSCDGTCQDGQCVECSNAFTPVCQDGAVKSCKKNKFKFTECEEGQICSEGECVEDKNSRTFVESSCSANLQTNSGSTAPVWLAIAGLMGLLGIRRRRRS
ncbi:MAG: peptidoglycan DD-metalloendopeptidase family protein [Proteobacteria bacterium]|nr:peptidoglycan DD-metalloendopeptidase family protein [Pseudomonadota bacterium]